MKRNSPPSLSRHSQLGEWRCSTACQPLASWPCEEGATRGHTKSRPDHQSRPCWLALDSAGRESVFRNQRRGPIRSDDKEKGSALTGASTVPCHCTRLSIFFSSPPAWRSLCARCRNGNSPNSRPEECVGIFPLGNDFLRKRSCAADAAKHESGSQPLRRGFVA